MKTKVLILVAIFLLTGCSNNLKCNIKTNTYKSKIIISFKNNEPKNYLKKEKIYFTKKDTKNIYYKLKTSEYKYLINNNYTKIKNKNNKIYIKTKYNFKKRKRIIENKLEIEKNDTRKKAYQKIKSLGYTCN